jgi:hypothetical protein
MPIDLWQQDLLAGRLGRIRAAFAAAGLGGYEVIRSPAPAMLQSATNRFLLNYWLDERGDSFPPVAAVDPVRLGPALGRIMIVEPVDQGADFRYRLYGTNIAAVSGFELTGKLLSTHPIAPELAGAAMAMYRSIMQRPEAVLTVNLPRFAAFSRWERIMLPFTGSDGALKRIVVGNAAFDSKSQEVRC